MSEDAGREMADINMANCWRRLAPMDLYADFFKTCPHRVSSGASLIGWVCEFALIRGARNLNTRVPMDTRFAETHFSEAPGAPQDNEHFELNAGKGQSKGFKGQKKDADMMKGKGKMKGFSEGKNPPQHQQQYGKGWIGANRGVKLESADQVCTPWKSVGAHKGQATTP